MAAALRHTPGANEQAIIDALDRLLAPNDSLAAQRREYQIKPCARTSASRKSMSSVFSAIFIAAAALLLKVGLSRQVATQRSAIAALKALGYTNTAIAVYLKLVLLIVFFGIVMGGVLDALLGHKMTSLYTDFSIFKS